MDSTVEALLQRTADGVLAEDRREALADLRDLLSHNAQATFPLWISTSCFADIFKLLCSSVQAQLAVGAQGLPVLCTIVKEEREDTDMLRAALECLTIAIGNPTQHTESSGKVGWSIEHRLEAYKGAVAIHALMACRDLSPQH